MNRPIRRGLALCGGGFNGVSSAAFLGQLEEHLGQPLSTYFDCIGGTSTGAILASLLVCPNLDGPYKGQPKFKASELAPFYKKEAPRIFPNTYLRTFDPLKLIQPRYPASGIEGTLHDYLGDAKLSDSLTDIIIPTYDRWAADAELIGKTTDMTLWQASRASSAAPTYFPEYCLGLHQYQDGGLAANDPSMAVWLHLFTKFPEDSYQILTISPGTWPARGKDTPAPKHLLQGAIGQVAPLLSGLVSTPMSLVHKYLNQLSAASAIESIYVNPVFPHGPGDIDDISDAHFDMLQAGGLAEWERVKEKFTA